MKLGFDCAELDIFSKQLERVAREQPKKSVSFLKKQGTKLKRETSKVAKRRVRKDSGFYHQSIKRGKVYTYNGAFSIRCYSSAPHAHLLEKGHRMVTHGGRMVGFVPGVHVFETAGRTFKPKFEEACEDFVDEVMDV